MKHILWMLLPCLLVAACSKNGNSTQPDPPPPPPTGPVWDANAMRGVWLTTTASTGLDSKDNIKATVQTCKQAGINNIFVVVYNNARTIYPSQVMQDVIGIRQLERFAGRDPLQELIEEAKAQQIKVHAWFEYGFAASYSANGGPIVAAKPHWASKDQDGKLTVKNGFDWLNAFHPEVQQFVLDLFKEVTNKYDVAGVQGDDRMPALPSTGGYDDYTVNLYKAENGGNTPPGHTEAGWINWRSNKLSQFQKRLYTELKALKPTLQITLSPSVYPWGKNEYLQDWPTWVDSGWADAIIPQVYRYDINAYNATLSQQLSYHKNKNVAFYPGVLLRVADYTAGEAFLTQMISSNRNNGCKGEVYFFYEGIRPRISWFQGVYPYIK